MRLFPITFGFLFAVFFGVIISDGIQPRGKEAENQKEKKSLMHASDRGKKAIDSIVKFPYPSNIEGKKIADTAAEFLNSAEDAWRGKEKENLQGGKTIILHGLNLVDLQIQLIGIRLIIAGKTLEAGYTICWNSAKGKWEVKELPKKK